MGRPFARGLPTLRTKLRRDIVRQWPQFVAVAVTVLLGVALFGASYDAYRNLDASYGRTFAEHSFADLWVSGGAAGDFARAAADVRGVAATRTRTRADVPLRIGDDSTLRGRVIGMPVDDQPAVNQVTVLRGDDLRESSAALVERHVADHFGVSPGDTVAVRGADGWRRLRVAGVVSSAEYLWPAPSRQQPLTLPGQFGVLFVSETLARELAGGGPNQALVRLTSDARGTSVAGDLERRAHSAGATEVLTRAEQPSNSVLQEDISGFRQLSFLFPLLFLSAAGLAAYVLIGRRVRSERAAIGMLRAGGASRRQIRGHYLAYGTAAALAGAVPGIVLGVVGARGLTDVYLDVIGLPPSAAVVEPRAETFAIGLAFGLVAGLVSALAPATLAARVAPAEAMRPEAPPLGGRRRVIERVAPPLRRLPATWLLVVRGIGRNPRRTGFTALGTVLALLLILTSWTMIDSMRALAHTQFDVVQRQDARVDFAGPAGAERLAEVRALPQVERAEPMAQLPAALGHGDRSYATALTALPRGTDMHGFRTPDGEMTTLPREGVLVGEAVRERLDVRAGDEITVTVEGQPAVRAEVAGFLEEPLGTYAYVALDRLPAFAEGAEPTSALLRLAPGVDPQAGRDAVTAAPGVAAYTDNRAMERLFDDFTGLFYAFVAAMLVLGGLMAFAIIFTTMSVSILERRREVATLRCGGVSRRRVARLIAAENLVVTVLGIGPGLLLGVLGGRAFLATYSSDQFRLDLTVQPGTLLGSAAAILAVAAISQWPGLRAVGRLDLAAVIRERTG